MKDTPMNKNHNSTSKFGISPVFAFALAFITWLPATVQAQNETKPMKDGEQMTTGDSATTLTQSCPEMMEKQKTMMEEMKARDAALTDQVTKMNSAPENAKTPLMADIITKMVEQQTADHAKMEKMHAKMMQHMMEHMKMGKESMSKCPMMKSMKGMKGMDDQSKDASKSEPAEKE
ncbi:MAG: hypothetical protein ABI600_07630 [Luteolibacter sp.]